MLRLGRTSFERIAKAAQLAVPDESCGLIVGKRSRDSGGDTIIVDSIRPSPNLARDRGEYFEIDSGLHIQLQRELRDGVDSGDGVGEEIIGVYHSHPGGHAFPSREDVGQANYPGWVWVITSVDADGLTRTAAFLHIEGGGNSHLPAKFKEIKIVVED